MQFTKIAFFLYRVKRSNVRASHSLSEKGLTITTTATATATIIIVIIIITNYKYLGILETDTIKQRWKKKIKKSTSEEQDNVSKAISSKE